MFFYGLRNERNMVKSRLSCLATAEKVGDETLLNDAENGAIVDAPLAREILYYCTGEKWRFEPIETRMIGRIKTGAMSNVPPESSSEWRRNSLRRS